MARLNGSHNTHGSASFGKLSQPPRSGGTAVMMASAKWRRIAKGTEAERIAAQRTASEVFASYPEELHRCTVNSKAQVAQP